MIYITQDLYLSDELYGVDQDPNNPILGWHNLLEKGSITADFELDDYPATNIQTNSTGDFWRSSDDSTTQYLYMTVSPAQINYLGVAGHNFAGAEILLQHRADPGDAWTNIGDSFIPDSNHAIMIYFASVYTSSYWRLKIIPFTDTAPRASNIYLGKMLRLTRKIYVGHKPILFDKKTKFYTGESENGNFNGRVIQNQKHNLKFMQNQVSAAWVREYLKPWLDVSLERPFFFAWRPSNYPKEIAFAWLNDDVVPENISVNGNMRYDIDATALAPLR